MEVITRTGKVRRGVNNSFQLDGRAVEFCIGIVEAFDVSKQTQHDQISLVAACFAREEIQGLAVSGRLTA